jgi:hypothetical protein
MIGCICILVTFSPIITISIELSLIYTLYSSPLHMHKDSVSTSRLLATDLNTETSASNHYEVFFLFRL